MAARNVYQRAMQGALNDIFPTVIANIITGYLTVFKRPFQKDRCLVCDQKATWFNSLCRDHHTICLFCCDNTATDCYDDDLEETEDIFTICDICEARHGSSWMKFAENAYDTDSNCEDMYQTFYRDDDFPIDIGYFKQGMFILGMVYEEGEKCNKESKEVFEELGGMEKAREIARKIPDCFENMDIFGRWKEAERRIGSFTWSTVERLIHKL